MRDVVVTGVGIVCALGSEPLSVLSDWKRGRSALTTPTDERSLLPLTGFGRSKSDLRSSLNPN